MGAMDRCSSMGVGRDENCRGWIELLIMCGAMLIEPLGWEVAAVRWCLILPGRTAEDVRTRLMVVVLKKGWRR